MLHPIVMALLAGTFTWFATGVGAAIVVFGGQNGFSPSVMELLFGSSAGVMLAASFFSLLGPAVEYSRNLAYPGWIPVLSGFLVGVGFIKFVESFLPEHSHSPPTSPIVSPPSSPSLAHSLPEWNDPTAEDRSLDAIENAGIALDKEPIGQDTLLPTERPIKKSLWLLIIAVTLHNIPEGIVLGVSFGGISDGAEDGTNRPTLNDAILLTIAMALQNLPEGLAISVPLRKAGLSRKKSFCLGQLSGAVEVLGALLGAAFVLMVQSILPYALTFAAGCMIYVVVTELLPHSQKTNSWWGTGGVLGGFAIMMTLDTSFG